MSGSITGAGIISTAWPRYMRHPITGRDVLVSTQQEEAALLSLAPQLPQVTGAVPPSSPPTNPYGPPEVT